MSSRDAENIPSDKLENSELPIPAPPVAADGQPEERRMLEDTGKLSGATAVSYLINLAGGLVIARLLGPAMMGVWKAVQLAGTYSAFSNIGATYGIDRSCPALVSQGRMRTYQRLVASSAMFTIGMSVLLSAVSLVIAIPMEYGPAKLAFLAFSVFVLVQPFYQHGEAALNVEKRFGAKARVTFFSTTFRIIFSIIGAWLFGLAGVLAAFIAVLAWSAWYMARHSRMDISIRALRRGDMRLVRKLIGIGLPITLMVFGEQFFLTIDKWIVATLLGNAPHGLYQMAIMPLPILMLVPMALRQVVSIDIYDKFARIREMKPCRDVFDRSVTAIALGTPLIIGAVWFGVPWLVNWFLEEYRPSIGAIKLHAVMIYPILIVQTGFAIAVIARRERQTVLALVSAGAVASCISAFAILYLERDFNSVLVVHGAAWLMFGVAFLFHCLRWTGENAVHAWYRVARWFFPMLFLAIELPLVEWLLRRTGLVPHTFAFAITGGVIHLLFCTPFLIGLEKRTRGISHGLAIVKKRIGS